MSDSSKAPQPLKTEGTVLFCDIRNFTALFDERDPLEAVDFANTVLSVLGEVIEREGGIVDRFTGDGFLAHFGFARPDKDHASRACCAIRAIRQRLNAINTERYVQVESVLNVGIGVHTGVAAYCQIETSHLRQVTVLGDTVNTAARIEEMTKYFVVDALVSASTYRHVADRFAFKKMPAKSVRGKQELASTYWFLPTN